MNDINSERTNPKVDIENFLNGLKIVIQRNWLTQEEFAEGVTSKVNLSNVLRGKVGTSRKMRIALAEKAGMSVEDIAQIGSGRAVEVEPNLLPPIEHLAPNYSLEGMDSVDFLGAVSHYKSDLVNEADRWAKSVGQFVEKLASERIRLSKQNEDYLVVLNSISEAIKVINTDYKIVFSNRANSARNAEHVGDDCLDKNGIISEVFRTSSKVWKVCEDENGKKYSRIGHPVFRNAAEVVSVCVVSRPVDDFLQLLVDQGWTAPK